MVDAPNHVGRPLWVRFAAREGTKRPAARTQAIVLALIACLGLLIAGVESAGGSLLGGVALILGLGLAVLCGAAALWSWLAVRWVDRNDRWA